jgi:hypothetical protein
MDLQFVAVWAVRAISAILKGRQNKTKLDLLYIVLIIRIKVRRISIFDLKLYFLGLK